MDTGVVKFDALANAVRPAAEYHHFFAVRYHHFILRIGLAGSILHGQFKRRIIVRRQRGKLRGTGVDQLPDALNT